MDIKHMSALELENEITKYIKAAAQLAEGRAFSSTYAYIAGLRTPEQMAGEIKRLGAAYLEKMKALRNASPVVRGDTISIYGPKPTLPANAPSKEDELFLTACRKRLKEDGFVRAADADTYEEIAKKYPDSVFPRRVRGSEAKKWLAMRADDVVSKRIKLWKK